VINQNKDYIIKNGYVYRPKGIWTKNVHKFLHYLPNNGFSAAPLPVGFDELGNEIVTYIPGNTGGFPSNANLKSNNILTSAAKLLRKLHNVSTEFLQDINIDHSQ